MRDVSLARRAAGALGCAFVLAGCGSIRPAPSRVGAVDDGRVITAGQIAARPGIRTAWDALRVSGVPLSLTEGRDGRPTRLRSRRGRSSVVLTQSDVPLLIVDGARVGDFRVLRDIDALSIAYIRVRSAVDGTTSQGTGAGGGVIEVHTRAGPP